MLRRPTAVAACAVTLLAVGVAPATALTQPVDIAVLLAQTTAEDSPVKAFVAEGVVVGGLAGLEWRQREHLLEAS